jgi:hypothetical protein
MPKEDESLDALGACSQVLQGASLSSYRVQTEKNATKLPGDDWWVLTFALAPVVDVVNTTLVLLQSRSIVISQQAEFINNLIALLTDLFNVLLADEAHADNNISLESL